MNVGFQWIYSCLFAFNSGVQSPKSSITFLQIIFVDTGEYVCGYLGSVCENYYLLQFGSFVVTFKRKRLPTSSWQISENGGSVFLLNVDTYLIGVKSWKKAGPSQHRRCLMNRELRDEAS